jgi:hypothetical protein
MSETTRRTFGRLMLTLPAASLALPARAGDEAIDLPELLARREPGLGPDQRKRLRKLLSEAQKPVQAVRDFVLPDDAAPAFRFRPLHKPRG